MYDTQKVQDVIDEFKTTTHAIIDVIDYPSSLQKYTVDRTSEEKRLIQNNLADLKDYASKWKGYLSIPRYKTFFQKGTTKYKVHVSKRRGETLV